MSTLFTAGIKGLLELAKDTYGFQPAAAYLYKCHLCMDIRLDLILGNPGEFPEFQPMGFYENYV